MCVRRRPRSVQSPESVDSDVWDLKTVTNKEDI